MGGRYTSTVWSMFRDGRYREDRDRRCGVEPWSRYWSHSTRWDSIGLPKPNSSPTGYILTSRSELSLQPS